MARKKKKDEAVIVEIGAPEPPVETVLEEQSFVPQPAPMPVPKRSSPKPPSVVNERSPLTGAEKFKLVCVRKVGRKFRREVLAIGTKVVCLNAQRDYEARILKGEASRDQRLIIKRMAGRI